VTRNLDADYLVVGAGAMGLAFADALVDHADVRVALVDRRDGVGGHWRGAYPFVRLHQASTFYGVASTVLGGGVQTEGPERGLHERADRDTICAYYDRVVRDRLLPTGRVEVLTRHSYWSDHRGDRTVVSLDGGPPLTVPPSCRVVDARYLAPDIPSETPPRFVGSGKTATDAIVWLLGRGVDPDAVCWVRPRDPWMLDRAVIQPDPAVYLGMVADLLHAAGRATSLPDLFLRLEGAGIMLRIDRSVVPTMAKAPTLGRWELDLLRTVEHVVRLGHVRAVERGRLELADGSVAVADDALVVDCAADGLKAPPRVPVWRPDAITLQPIRAGFPCFGAALIGYVEATRTDDAEKNRLCPPTSYGNSLADWAEMNAMGMRSSAVFGAEPDIKAWADRVALNPARIAPDHPGSPALDDAVARLAACAPAGRARLAELAERS
jgi:hypothetical protein